MTTDTTEIPDDGFHLSPEQLSRIRPHALSRWSALALSWGEIRFDERENVLNLGAVPAIVRLSPALGDALAPTAPGRPVNYMTRPDGLRSALLHPDNVPPGADRFMATACGYIDAAMATPAGLLVSFFVLSAPAHTDLEQLVHDDALQAARCCLWTRANEATVRRSAWGLPIVDVHRASALALSLTSCAHDQHARVLRRLAEDEPLRAEDVGAGERLYAPAAWGPSQERVVDLGGGAVTTPNVAPGAISGSAHTSSVVASISTTEAVIGSVTLATNGGYASVSVKCAQLPSVADGNNVIYRLCKGSLGGAILDTAVVVLAAQNPAAMLAIDESPAASQTYVLTARHDGTTGTAAAANMRMVAINLKK
jgi:hypothetical protein